ncbi:WXG100 family type VII secretion target [Arthrobacter sp. AZCC_0090]|uniref:WXG100 family type VII secretion target n=1 Tax=Arthrobacter sp. AZCC_0090 TaxID=2735881 RepID=UPI00161A6D27|nr:hypothetical protein [Arthrobacter sp. AZCC_0090]MBB6404591.1 uncharacterized protein YukE [Arthrobacter sp. AZCC_0090]
MAGNLWGADVAQLRQLAQQFGSASEALLNQSTHLSGQINNTTAWKGEDAARFTSEWNTSHRVLLMQTATSLKQESKKLLENASQQERASNGSGGGPMSIQGTGPGLHGDKNPWGPDWLAKGSTFRDIWGARSSIKAPFDLVKNSLGIYQVWQKGMPGLADFAGWSKLWGKLPAQSAAFNLLDSATDILGAKNLQKYVPSLNKLPSIFAENKWLFQGKSDVLESLGKGGLGRAIGWAGVGLNAYDTVSNVAKGNYGDAAVSGAKTALAVGSFLPPPAGTVCMVASAAWAVYDIPVVKNFVNGAVSNTVDAVADAGKAIGDGIADVGKGAAKFFGFG